ncbi:MAG: regulatory protein RecX [Gammaproteobacteria bacterium]
MNLLARREHSESELLRKLRPKNFPEAEIKTVLAKLAEEGLLSHSRFIENYIHYRSQKGYGPVRIRAELIERGLTEEFIEHHLNIADNAWLINVRTVWQKRFKNQLPRDFKTRAQQMRFLQYRGFTLGQIESIFQSEDEYER